MTGLEAAKQYKELNKQLLSALSTLEKKSNILFIRERIIDVQAQCPHFDATLHWHSENGVCPYCGKKLSI